MDNLGDWLYIVFLIIAAVSGLFGSGKKKKQPKPKSAQPHSTVETSPDSKPAKGFWEILQEELNGPEQAPAPTKKVIAKKTITPPNTVKSKAYSTTTPFLAGEKAAASIPQQQNAILMEEIDSDNHSITREDFNLQDIDEVRKAIIYSEILNRKY